MIKRIVVGLNIPPAFVGAVRAALLLGITALIGELQRQAGVLDWGDYAYASPIILAGLRALEGVADQILTPHQNNTGGF